MMSRTTRRIPVLAVMMGLRTMLASIMKMLGILCERIDLMPCAENI